MSKFRFNWGRRPTDFVGTHDNTISTTHCRPTTRGECRGGLRPCPFVGCRYHLYLDEENYGKRRISKLLCNFPDLDPLDIPETCALDVAEQGGIDISEIGVLLNLSKSGVENTLKRALLHVKSKIS
jgi:hypothetical protein